jgi:hypothetical protein
MLSSFVFRAIRDALPGNPIGQERILGASLLAMAIADVSGFHLMIHRITLFQVTQ